MAVQIVIISRNSYEGRALTSIQSENGSFDWLHNENIHDPRSQQKHELESSGHFGRSWMNSTLQTT